MEKFEYFPTQINREERPDFLEELSPIFEHAIKEVSDYGGNLLQSNLLLENTKTTNFKSYLLLSSVNILRGQGYSTDKYDFYLSGLWAQEIKDFASTNVHTHKNSQLCGWFFIEVEEESSYVVYHDTRANKAIIELDYNQGNEILNATGAIFFNNLRAGTCLFNNSWVPHQIVSNGNKKPTRCFHFVVSHKERMCNIP